MRDPLNRSTAPMVVRLFDACFKQGVIDACNLGDDYSVREFIDEHKESFTFGVLGDDERYDWQLYRFTLYRWARMYKLTTLAENYILFIKSRNYMWALLPFCLQFYIMGAEEWLAYPNPSRISLFKANLKVHWDINYPIKKFTLPDYVSYMHEIAHAYQKVPEESRQIGPSTMDGYCQALYNLTRKYVEEKNGLEADA